MKLSRTLVVVVAAGALVLAACGDDSDDSSSASDPTTTTEASETTTTTAAEESAGGTTELSGEEAAAADTVTTVFDSSVPFDEKVALIEGGESLRATYDAYVGNADAVGGITVAATAVEIAGDTATVTYSLAFAGSTQYEDLTKQLVRSGDGWVVPTEEFCAFTAQAGAACAA